MVLIIALQSLPVYEFTTDPDASDGPSKIVCILSPTETLTRSTLGIPNWVYIRTNPRMDDSITVAYYTCMLYAWLYGSSAYFAH